MSFGGWVSDSCNSCLSILCICWNLQVWQNSYYLSFGVIGVLSFTMFDLVSGLKWGNKKLCSVIVLAASQYIQDHTASSGYISANPTKCRLVMQTKCFVLWMAVHVSRWLRNRLIVMFVVLLSSEIAESKRDPSASMESAMRAAWQKIWQCMEKRVALHVCMYHCDWNSDDPMHTSWVFDSLAWNSKLKLMFTLRLTWVSILSFTPAVQNSKLRTHEFQWLSLALRNQDNLQLMIVASRWGCCWSCWRRRMVWVGFRELSWTMVLTGTLYI